MIFEVIGIGNRSPRFSADLLELIAGHQIFSGGERHYELVKQLLPAGYSWIPVRSPLEKLYRAYSSADLPVVVFASGDPLFYGIANTLQQQFPGADIRCYPYFSSIQLLAHRARLNMNQLQSVSVHGRSWKGLDQLLISQAALIGVLTDQEKSPAAIASRLLRYGIRNYRLWVGEDLEGSKEQVRELTPELAANLTFYPLNCLILERTERRQLSFGLPDGAFHGLEGRPGMITKMPVRLCTLHHLDLAEKKVLWDLGFCTGSLSIEAMLHFPHLEVHAFEKRAVCETIIAENQRKFGVPGISVHMGDFYSLDFSTLPCPDAVFIGGHGGRLPELLALIDQVISLGATIVINTVREESALVFRYFCGRMGWNLQDPLKLKVDSHHEITILKATKEN